MSWNATKLKSAYRDQLIRELQHLKARKKDKPEFSVEVKAAMKAVDRADSRDGDGAVGAKPGRGPFWQWLLRRWEWFWRRRTTRHDDRLEASELYLLEATLLEYLEKPDLKMRIAGYRDMLTNLLTTEAHHAMQSQFCDLSKEDDEDKLRGEARALLSRLCLRYEGVPAVEGLRRDIVFWIYITTAAIIGLVIGLVSIGVTPLILIAVAGAIGASISTISRLYDLDSRHEPFKTWLTIENGQMTLILAPVVGATFAVVLLAMFGGGIVSGKLFPEFTKPVDGSPWGAAIGMPLAEFAKLMLWGFASGWAERMVPDVLNKLAPQTGQSAASSAAPSEEKK